MKQCLKGKLRVPGDKSISHRALIFATLSKGRSTISGLSPGNDCLSTIACLKALGLTVEGNGKDGSIVIESPGPGKLLPPAAVLDAGNSATTMRLLAAVAAGQPFRTEFTGDASLKARPMSGVLNPLLQMGADITLSGRPGHAPFAIRGGCLQGISYEGDVASAQVQTAVLLAGLYAQGTTTVAVPGPVRDHTLRLFRYINVPHATDSCGRITVRALSAPVDPYCLEIPADISSAAFFMVAAALLPGSDLLLYEVGMNPGRVLIINVLQSMGADITLSNERIMSGEPAADIRIKWNGRLKGATIDSSIIASGIDEIPILSLAGALSAGSLRVCGAGQLRLKESDRLSAIITNLRAAGAMVTELADGFEIAGQAKLAGGSLWQTYGDHRLAMTGAVAGLSCERPVLLDDTTCVSVSYPGFMEDMAKLTADS